MEESSSTRGVIVKSAELVGISDYKTLISFYAFIAECMEM